MAKYKVYASLGGAKYIETVEVTSKEEAAKITYEEEHSTLLDYYVKEIKIKREIAG